VIWKSDESDVSQAATARTFGELETVGPVRLHCAVDGASPTEFELHLFILPPQARYTVMTLGTPATVGGKGPLVRISSACIWSHLFASQHCDCSVQLEMAKAMIAREGMGLVVYCHDHHGKGIGLRNHFLVYAEGQRRGRELVVDAYEQLGFKEDYRNYDDVARILRHIGITKCRLLTNSPRRIQALKGSGIGVVRVPLAAKMTPLNSSELTVKRTRLGHLIDAPENEDPNERLDAGNLDLLRQARDDRRPRHRAGALARR
jgi:GTP cyclohydrolase II